MKLADLKAMATADAAETVDARRMMAGKYAQKSVRALESRDWQGAVEFLIKAASRRPEYAAAIALVEACRNGSKTNPARAAASRENGKRGGRPRKVPPENIGTN